jgi:valyl-tRNA synthetase
MNCGFVGWVDEEWPETMQSALRRLWSMYHESHSQRIDERLENARLMQVLVDEKNKAKSNYNTLMADVSKMLESTQKQVMADNLKKMNEEKEYIFDLTRAELEAEVIKLNEKVAEMEEEKSRYLEMKGKWEKEMEDLKEQKKKAEYTLFDAVKVSFANKEKLAKIKEICADM